jgi:hypothetical protein
MLNLTPIQKYIPSKVEPPEILNKIRNQQAWVLNCKNSREHNLSKELYKHYNCNTYIDIGCWAGAEAYKFYKDVNPKKTILIDAVPSYLQLAKELFTRESCENVFANELLMLARTELETWPGYFCVDIDATIDTSTVNGHEDSEWFDHVEPYKISTSLNIETMSKVPALFKEHINSSRCFLKTDLDGLDHQLLRWMFQEGVMPTVIKFEMFTVNPRWLLVCTEFLELCKNAGYAVPPLNVWFNQNCSMSNFFISKDFWACDNHVTVMPGRIHNGKFLHISKNW